MATRASAPASAFGALLRSWRQRRRLSQLALALDADISQRHLSFVESGRAQPSRELVLLLADHLDVPLRDRNKLLLAAGYAPVFNERPLDNPAMDVVRGAVERVLQGHEPFPAIAVDRHWTLVASNSAIARWLVGVSPALLQPPVNVLRLSLHPEGLAPRIANLAQWRAHLLERLRRQVEVSADPVLEELLAELRGYAAPAREGSASVVRAIEPADNGVFIPLQFATDQGIMSFISTTTVFGTPVDVTVSELALECFFPADAFTADYLKSGVTAESVASR
ncbi:MAG TPA: helix-turn-helix transcriptional regulator [Gemmatimonadaceae bacterium]|jgi:transcriptional regulator with XRE-family HTH domain|nr:helix-turn-helix transcriptional regulator [Gemmatimonadaceae bacterium]